MNWLNLVNLISRVYQIKRIWVLVSTFMDVVDEISSSTEMVDRACRVAKTRKILKNGEKIIDEGEAYQVVIEKLKELKVIWKH